MLDSPLATLFVQAIPTAFFDLLAAAGLGAALIAFVCECLATSRKNAFLDKFALHLTTMSFWALLISIFAGTAALFVAGSKLPGLTQWLTTPVSPALPMAATLGFTLLALALYKFTWQNLRQNKGPHLALGALVALATLGTFFASTIAIRGFTARFLAENAQDVFLTELLAPSGSPLFWPLALASVLLCLTFGGGVGAAFLVHRRTRDDFGRDYYNYALPKATLWALFPLVGLMGTGGWLYAVLPDTLLLSLRSYPLVCYAGSAPVLLTLAAACWLPVALSKQPLRLKGLTIVAGLLLWALDTLLLTLLLILAPTL